ncbi:TetR/AcrR family transcriptional regulator [Nocardia carnea]|uniref:TetR/AcrR family transcriptional regulator n=1 Tax=Nocardia carnea TaxID=37328 RepID=A0ABW7TPA5_9NOCA|nr:TetR/AcrR family transcriptional regulator [Nocardia carnea]
MSTPDRRVRRTRETLHRALIELMMERAYDRISVSDVIARADIGRSTFYAHYRDKDDLLVVSCGEHLRREIARSSDRGRWAPVRVMIGLAARYPQVYEPLIGPKASVTALRGCRSSMAAILREHLDEQSGPRTDDLTVTALSWALVGLLTAVADRANPVAPELVWRRWEAISRSVVTPAEDD